MAMRTIAILPVKSFGAAKQRLSAAFGGDSREALAQAMFSDVLAALREVPAIDAIAVVTGNELAEEAARDNGLVLIDDAEDTGQSDATVLGIAHALREGYDRALLVPGDTPLLEPSEVTALLDRAGRDHIAATIVPDRHGEGTNALLLSPPTAIAPSFGPGSLARHRAAALAAAVSCRVDEVPSLMLDVDTPDDLARVSAELGPAGERAPRTRRALKQLEPALGGRV